MRPDAVDDALDVPRYSGEAFVEMAERLSREGASVASEEPCGEFLILSRVDGAERHKLCTLVEGALGRDEHGVHHVLSGAGEDEMRVRNELDVASEKRFRSFSRNSRTCWNSSMAITTLRLRDAM